ncbi:uncharacterized protein Nmag_0678 [Natrialba magadii ATCC 43099]|uniref:Uncharacterized protein n=1 Tax=Natrialba magadii (strain ATCC 43099 / DSM 3394 / CCM 3739 / CIP 104546 / IAM 13178 / JCM 8861 / NBRC 102185 / NCIMB 2190 / MS3) TaxID=547559 RepID=D3SZC9_NATMM|nr:hypothetical protein [Natrialba magadii]ADD04263.1 uncharacterized protein Nmag_0678 [Natrialba magadii ATCC 43099]ELY26666.1 hypothetical protein C500_15935 [Natrialba magadii ATCC 43099]
MVPDPPSLTRRQLLAGAAGGVGLTGSAVVALGATRPTALPNSLVDVATNYYPKPPAPSELWQPTVTEAHARMAVELLAETEAESLERWDEIDADERRMRSSGGWLGTAEDSLADGEYNEALSNARYGMQLAGEHLGEARAKQDAVTLEELAERSFELLDRIDAVIADIDGYPVLNPERDLAWYVQIESELQVGRGRAGWTDLEAFDESGTESGDGDGDEKGGGSGSENGSDQSGDADETDNTPDIDDYDPGHVGDITAGLLQAEIHVETAERYRDRLWDDVGVDGGDAAEASPHADHLETVRDELSEELESMPTRDEVQSSYLEDDAEGKRYGPYEFAHDRLARWVFPAGTPVPWRGSVDDDFLLVQVLGLSRGLADWRAHEFAVENLVIEPADDDFDPGHLLDEQRRARSTYESTIEANQTPFLVVFSEQGIGDLRVTDVSRSSWDGYEDEEGAWTPWNERIQNYLHALLGRARLREYPELYDRLVAGE